MKRIFLNSTLPIVLMGILLAFAPTDTFGQHKARKVKSKKEVVVTPEKQYKKLPRQGARVTTPPQKTVIIRHGHYDYHFDKGVFYRTIGGSYVVVAPPVGIRVSVLPAAAYRLHYLNRPYFYYYGVFYTPLPDGAYEVVDAPIGARVDALPDGYEVFELDGRVYYRLGDTYYKAVVEDNGLVAYEVVRV